MAPARKRLTLARAIVPGASRAVRPRAPTRPVARPTSRYPGVVAPPTNPSALRTAREATVPVPGVVPGTTYRVPAPPRRRTVAPAVGLPPLTAGLPRVAGPPAPRGQRPTHALTGPRVVTPYHTPRPAPSGTSSTRTPTSAPTPAPAPMTPADAAKAVQGGVRKAAGAVNQGAAGATGALPAPSPTPLPPVPVPTAPPAAVPPSPAPAAADPYAAYPPEVAALLRANDEQTSAQQAALRGYFNQQAGAAQTFATGIGQQTANLAQLAGIPTAMQNQATSGLPGAVTALPGAFGQIATQLGAAQGLNTTNAAAMMPGFLRQAGGEAVQTLGGAGQKARGDIISNYVDQQGQMARTMAEQQGMDARSAAEIESRERVAATQQATQGVNNLLDFVATMANNAQASGDRQTALQYQNIWHNLSAQTSSQNAQLSAATTQRGQDLTAATRVATSNATGARADAKSAQTLRTRWAGDALKMMQGEKAPTVSVRQGSGSNTTTRTGWYDAAGNFTTTPQYTGGTEPADVMSQMLSEGMSPRDAYNITNSAARRLGTWTGREADVYGALTGSGMTPMRARALTKQLTGRDPIAGPPAPRRRR